MLIIGIAGGTGSGKTTILSLICRNYDIQKGQILIDGIDIQKIKISSLRRHFGQMLQDVFLFSGTIRSNIVLGEDFTEEEMEMYLAMTRRIAERAAEYAKLSSDAYTDLDSAINPKKEDGQ